MDRVSADAQAFMDLVFAMGSWTGDGPAPSSLPLHGARAMSRIVRSHPAVAEGRTPATALQLFGQDGDDGLLELRYDAVGFLVGGALALGMTGAPLDDLAVPLLIAAIDVDPASISLRKDLLRKPIGPPDPLFPHWLDGLDRLKGRDCWAGVVKAALELGRYGGGLLTADAAGITGLSRHQVCGASTLDLLGSGFGAGQPAGTSVYLPTGAGACRPARVISWSDSRISVEVPAGVRPGCVGFVRGGGGGGFAGVNEVTGTLVQCVGAVGEIWGRGFSKVLGPVVSCPPCLPGGVNRIDSAGPPVIHAFGFAPAQVEPGGQPVLSWNVESADTLSITHLAGIGPALSLPSPLPGTGSVTLPPVTGSSRIQATYRVVAQNACGQVTRDAVLVMTRTPKLSVSRIEVVQSVQKPDNSVRLTAARRTGVRVFLDSGISDGFNLGLGPNRVGGLTATLYAESLDSGVVRDCGPPWNPAVTAATAPNRDLLADSVNFDVPLSACTGNVRFRCVVELPGPPGDPPLSWASGSTDVSFTAKPQQELLPWIFTDPSSTSATPTMTDFFDNLLGPARRQPFPESGFIVNPPILVTLSPIESLKLWSSWERLVARMATTIFLFPSTPVGGIRSGIAPSDSAYPWAGMALPRVLLTVPSFVAQMADSDTCAHELGHTYGLLHVNCGGPAGPYDGRLPLTLADPALNVVGRTLLAAGANEEMTYCAPRWPSVEHWDAIFDRIPI